MAAGTAGPNVGRPCFQYVLGRVERATLIQRYKRFLADVELRTSTCIEEPRTHVLGEKEHPHGKKRNRCERSHVEGKTTVYCPNTGPMVGLLDASAIDVCVQRASNGTKRKYPRTLELVRAEPNGCWVGVHSARANAVVDRALSLHALPFLEPYVSYRREVRFGSDARLDFQLERPDGTTTYVEVKSVTLALDVESGERVATFPDTRSERARKHLRALVRARASGHGSCCLYLVQRDDCVSFRPSLSLDPEYASCLQSALEAGVQAYALGARWWLDEDDVAHLSCTDLLPWS
mmetsp:Transcript_3250/g.20198  ORF Transcript_3250/g.20198 Transcript_3250/m.20198 type:complete len:292 (+) Transcript_3250:4499-5374(+)